MITAFAKVSFCLSFEDLFKEIDKKEKYTSVNTDVNRNKKNH
jgi:hypothetical protein